MTATLRVSTFELLAILSLPSLASGPNDLIQHYSRQAASEQAGFTPNAKRGAAFYRQPFASSTEMPACVSCHTEQPGLPGRHAITGKRILPLAPAANNERFSDPAKVEKWFGRNCRDVLGRACSAAEKADFIAYLNEVR